MRRGRGRGGVGPVRNDHQLFKKLLTEPLGEKPQGGTRRGRGNNIQSEYRQKQRDNILREEDGRPLSLPQKWAALPPKLKVFIKHDVPPTAEELGRPARLQIAIEDKLKISYTQGQEDYNIWYHKYMTQNYGFGNRPERVPAATHLNVFTDSGFTKADFNGPASETPGAIPVCLYFAMGSCVYGSDCKFYHRVPTEEDSLLLDQMHDVFGRERHAEHRPDMMGTGSFHSDSRTLFVGDFNTNEVSDWNKRLETAILEVFSIYGPIMEIKFMPHRNFAFVTYKYRAAAEFARVAMNNYHLLDSKEVLTVKWASQQTRINKK